MLNLFMQVPEMVRTRLAKRCKDVYEFMRQSQSAMDEVDQAEVLQQVCALPLHRRVQICPSPPPPHRSDSPSCFPSSACPSSTLQLHIPLLLPRPHLAPMLC